MRIKQLYLSALVMASAALAGAIPTMTGQWNFTNSNLDATVGTAMAYRGTTQSNTSFGKASTFGMPNVEGVDKVVMAFPACNNSQGYIFHPNTSASGGSDTNQYTILMDIGYKTVPSGYGALLQTDPNNSNDAECFCYNGGIGISGQYDGELQEGAWHRVVWTMNNRVFKKYIDGQLVGTQNLDGYADDRWSMYSGASGTALVFTDNDNETAPGYCSQIAVYDGVMTDQEVADLGGLYVSTVKVKTPPYLQNMKTNEMTIMWETSTDNAATVEYGTTTAYGQTATPTAIASKAATYIHKAVLTSLTPDTLYHYRVKNVGADPEYTDDATFKTAPDTNTGDFAFAFWSDSQGAVNGSNDHPTNDLFDHMAAQGIDFAVTAGDLSEAGDSSAHVRNFFLNRTCAHLGTKVPFFIAWGNHDAYNTEPPQGELNFIRQCASLPSQDRTDQPGKVNAGRGGFSYTYRGVYFCFIDDLHPDDIINGWLDAELASDACKNARMRVCVVHQPPYCDMWVDGTPSYRTNLVPKLEANNFVLCLSGHTHEYERGFLNNINYVICGGASWLDLTEPIVKDWEHITVGGAHNMDGAPRAGLLHGYTLFNISDGVVTAQFHTFSSTGEYTGIKDSFIINLPVAAVNDWSLQ
ncbi:hypothetical protein GX645_02405 [Candidatus Sumerlaeota bacterium]|nr:hypothetical protein [Candidatus Sumerlaeota bacterium]